MPFNKISSGIKAGVSALIIGAGLHAAPAAAVTLSGATVSGTQTVNGVTTFSESGSSLLYLGSNANDIYADAATGRMSVLTSSFFSFTGLNKTNDLTYAVTVTNDLSVAQSYDFHFAINEGKVSSTVGFGAAGAAIADLAVAVSINGVEAWSTSAHCQYSGCTSSGTDIGYTKKLGTLAKQFDFARYDGTVSLGTLAAGQSVQVEYSFHAVANSIGTAVAMADIGAYSPFLNNDFSSLGGVSVTAVPEPATAGFMTIGLGLLALRRRIKPVTQTPTPSH